MTQTNALIGLWAETSLHPGAGGAVDGIDLPIQREMPSGWPCVFGSAVKGALRVKAEDQLGTDNTSIRIIFGPDSQQPAEKDHAGALLIGDARILLLPVRSLTGHFKWVTCPAILKRLQRDSQRLGIKDRFEMPSPAANMAVTPMDQPSDLFLEEYRYPTQTQDLTTLINTLHSLSDIPIADLQQQLTIVNDDQFNYLCRFATPVNPHIAIDNVSKTVKPGTLWYEETLPPETVLYFALSAQKSRDKNNSLSAQDILNAITDDLLGQHPYLQLGGNETVGMGWCKVTIRKQEG